MEIYDVDKAKEDLRYDTQDSNIERVLDKLDKTVKQQQKR